MIRFGGYDDSLDTANIVVDGAPNRSSVLTLTHWPGVEQPAGLAADLSAEMAFRYLDDPPHHPPADIATNNHFDQDGLVGVHAMIEPESSLRQREVLIDVAAAGDFATFRSRTAARASMTIWSYAQPDRSPLGDQLRVAYPEKCRLLYEATLPLLIPMVSEPDRFRSLWADEDQALTASERAIDDGTVTIEEIPESDLAVVTLDASEALPGGHRFGSDWFSDIHPMALNNATRCCRLLIVHGRRYRYVDRYETWVQYRSRRLPSRVDVRPLADRLTELESGRVVWSAAPPSVLTPTLKADDESSLPVDDVRAELDHHLRTSPTAWDPFDWSRPEA